MAGLWVRVGAPCHRLLAVPKGSFFLYGVRGVGKSTWARAAFPDAHVVDLLDESRHQSPLTNPGLFGLEVQGVPRGLVEASEGKSALVRGGCKGMRLDA